MTYLIGKVLSDLKIDFVEFNGKVPIEKRHRLIEEFRDNPNCMVFLSTDGGGVELNLQSADCVINFEMPWNPAKLNQRIGRVNRIGQSSAKINVINLIAKKSIEERVLAGINIKQEVFDAVFDGGVAEVDLSQGKKDSFINKIREMLGEDLLEPRTETVDSPELDEMTPHFLNPELLAEKEPEVDLTAEEEEIEAEGLDTEPAGESPISEQRTDPDQLETVLNQGLAFLDSLTQMTTGKPLIGESGDKAIEINRETGEVVLRFKLPGV